MAPTADFSRAEIRAAMRECYDVLIAFVTSVQFQSVLSELDELDSLQKGRFIYRVLLNPTELGKYGVEVPDGVLIQRSAFGDRRPTLFCVKKYLPKKFHSAWENVNITFDALHDDMSVMRDAELCWRNPIRPDVQSALLSAGLRLEEIPESLIVKGSLMRERWKRHADL